MASKKRKLIEGLIPPKPKKKYDVTETKPGDKPWWVKEGLGRKPPNPRKKKTTPVLTAPNRPPSLPKGSSKGPIIGAAAITAATLAAPEKKKKKIPVIKATPFKERPKGFVSKKPGVGRGKWAGKYKVSGGDSLSKIAKRFGVSLKSLLNANPKFKKNPNLIKVGQNIAVPEAKIKGTGTSIYKGMSKSAMAKMQKGPPPIKKPARLKMQAGGRMSRVGLSPAEMARAGTMSEAKRKRYAKKGGIVNRRGGGQIGTSLLSITERASLYD